jgi:hypothetical protein
VLRPDGFAPVGLFLGGAPNALTLPRSAGIKPAVTDTQAQRIAREEAYWNAPRLFGLGLAFLGACLVVIYVIASI